MIRVPRLKQNRHGVYSIRVLWLDETGKRRETLHSLRTKHPTVARLLALQFNEAFERKRAMTEKPALPNLDELVRKYELDIGRGIMKAENPADHALMLEAIKAYKDLHGTFPPLQEAMQVGRNPAVAQANPPPRVPLKSMRFSQAVAAYLEEKKLDNNANTRKAKERTYADFQDLYNDLEINVLGKPELVQWKTHDMKRGIKATRVNARLGQLNDLFTWAINNGHYTASDKSPVEGLRIGKKSKLVAKHESFEPFNNDELKAIFSPAGYLKKFDKPDFYWLPIVALLTGARREEIATLLAADVKTVDGVPCLFIQKGKTADARRLIPLHPTLLALGFMDYAKHVQSLGQECLFPYLVETANGKGKNAGRQFSNWLGDLDITDNRKVFHSFRHTLITRLHAIHSNPAHVMQITGHAQETQGVHFQTYTHDVGLQALAETLGKLSYPLDFDSLKLTDPTFKAFLRRWKMIEDRKARAAKMRKEKTP